MTNRKTRYPDLIAQLGHAWQLDMIRGVLTDRISNWRSIIEACDKRMADHPDDAATQVFCASVRRIAEKELQAAVTEAMSR
jgi:hypothetical protein